MFKLFLALMSPVVGGFIRPEQFGFHRAHSTTLQLVRVVNHLPDAAKQHLSTRAGLLDVSKAFEKTLARRPFLQTHAVADTFVHSVFLYLQSEILRGLHSGTPVAAKAQSVSFCISCSRTGYQYIPESLYRLLQMTLCSMTTR